MKQSSRQSLNVTRSYSRVTYCDAATTLDSSISPISVDDYGLYQDFFTQDGRQACYGNSWVYITQACRAFGLGLKYYDHDVLVSLGKHNGHYVVVRPLGVIDERLLSLLKRLQRLSGKPVFIKKLFPEQVTRLQQLGPFMAASHYCVGPDQAYAGTYPWDAEAFADDDTYPEIIVDVDLTVQYERQLQEWFEAFRQARIFPTATHTLQPMHNSYRQFRRRIKKFLSLQLACSLRPYDTSMTHDVRQLLTSYFGTARQHNTQAYDNILARHGLPTTRDTSLSFVAYVVERTSPLGFFALERLDTHSAGLYAGIVLRQYPGLPEYLRLQMLLRLQQAGIKWLNLGGAETHSLQIYKRHMAPVEERLMSLLVYNAA